MVIFLFLRIQKGRELCACAPFLFYDQTVKKISTTAHLDSHFRISFPCNQGSDGGAYRAAIAPNFENERKPSERRKEGAQVFGFALYRKEVEERDFSQVKKKRKRYRLLSLSW